MPGARMLAMAAVTVAAIIGVTGSAMAATPTKGARYSAKVHPPHSNYPQIDLTVTSGGKRLSVIGPQEECGMFTAGEYAMFATVNNLRIDTKGRFKGSAKYTSAWGSHGFPSPASINDYTYRWTVSITGRFTDKRTAKGTMTYEALYGGGRADSVAVHTGQPVGQTRTCGKVRVKFTAKRGALHPIKGSIHDVSPEDF